MPLDGATSSSLSSLPSILVLLKAGAGLGGVFGLRRTWETVLTSTSFLPFSVVVTGAKVEAGDCVEVTGWCEVLAWVVGDVFVI